MTDDVDRFRRLEDIWDAAMTRPPADRAAFLREACGDDDAIRLELEATLVNVSRAEMFLEQPLAALAARAMEPSTDTVLTGLRLNTLVIGKMIGAGGMGQVYRARDTDLDRDVAVKVLSPEFADDADRLARFAREARVLASLNHPNIAQIHGLQSSGAVTAIVMELVSGETLADRIARGPIAVNEALPLARQIAAALEAAHEQGVIHRDLKPANIQVRTDGTVKVLDFGLAKTVHPTSEEAEDLNAAALSSVPGVVLGTAAYMSPEQARQKPVDRRVDMWAFGCVLFEMLTARPAFAGETRSAVHVRGHRRRTGLEGPAGIHTAGRSPIAAALPREGLRTAAGLGGGGPARDRRGRTRAVACRIEQLEHTAALGVGLWCPGCWSARSSRCS